MKSSLYSCLLIACLPSGSRTLNWHLCKTTNSWWSQYTWNNSGLIPILRASHWVVPSLYLCSLDQERFTFLHPQILHPQFLQAAVKSWLTGNSNLRFSHHTHHRLGGLCSLLPHSPTLSLSLFCACECVTQTIIRCVACYYTIAVVSYPDFSHTSFSLCFHNARKFCFKLWNSTNSHAILLQVLVL